MAPSLNKRSLFFMETATGVFLLDSLKNVVDFMWEHWSKITENAKLTVLSHHWLPSKADLRSLGRYKAWADQLISDYTGMQFYFMELSGM